MVNALAIRGLALRYPGRETPALDDLSFELPEHRLAFVLGPNGSGKSTLFRILLRLLRADSGEVEVFGSRLESYGPAGLAEAISYIPQSTEMSFNFSVLHTVVLGRVARRGLRASPGILTGVRLRRHSRQSGWGSMRTAVFRNSVVVRGSSS